MSPQPLGIVSGAIEFGGGFEALELSIFAGICSSRQKRA
jgi:hypothetical protein